MGMDPWACVLVVQLLFIVGYCASSRLPWLLPPIAMGALPFAC